MKKLVGGYKFFEAQDPGEEVVLSVRKHWLYLLRPFLLGLLMLFLIVLIFFLAGGKSAFTFENKELVLRLVVSTSALFTILFSYIVWLVKYLNIFLVTNERLVSINQLALFVRKISVLEYSSVEDVTVTQKGMLATFFNYGTVLIQTAGEKSNFEVTYIPEPEKLQDKIMELRDKFIIYESEHEEKLIKN